MAKKMELPSKPANDLISTREERDDAGCEKVVEIPLSKIDDFPNHPYRVKDAIGTMEMVESVKAYGVQTPAVVRKKPDGRYEMVSGHRRKYVSEVAALETIPCIVREMDDDDAVISMVDSNLQRQRLLPSEKAKAYKMKLDAIKRQGRRTDLTCRHNGNKSKSVDEIGAVTGESGRQVHRYVRLADLSPCLLDRVDDNKLSMNSAVELSYIPEKMQQEVANAISSKADAPTQSQAAEIRKLANSGNLTTAAINLIIGEKPAKSPPPFPMPWDKLYPFFQKGTPNGEIEDVIVKALEHWRQSTG